MVIPIYKTGEKHLASNCRPISTIFVICKMLESYHVTSSVTANMNSGTGVPESHLVITVHELARSFDWGEQVDVILLDF